MSCAHGALLFFFFIVLLGFNPEWNENFQFDIYVPDLALLRFLIQDHDSTSGNEFVAQYTLPLNSLKMGKFTSVVFLFLTLKVMKRLPYFRRAADSTQRSRCPSPPNRLTHFCVHTQDTDTCLCSIKVVTLSMQLHSLFTSWSWMPNKNPPSGMFVDHHYIAMTWFFSNTVYKSAYCFVDRPI